MNKIAHDHIHCQISHKKCYNMHAGYESKVQRGHDTRT